LPLSVWPPTQGHGHRGQPLQAMVPHSQLRQAAASRLQPRKATARRRQSVLATTVQRSCAALSPSERAIACHCVIAQACWQRQLVALSRRSLSEVVALPPHRHEAPPVTTRAHGVSSLTTVDRATLPLGCLLCCQWHDASASDRRPRGVAVPYSVLMHHPLRTVAVPWTVHWSAHTRALSPAA
jgi:hypothetical protein